MIGAFFEVALLMVCFCDFTLSYSGGAPSSACDTMNPNGHSFEAQAIGTNPYQLTSELLDDGTLSVKVKKNKAKRSAK